MHSSVANMFNFLLLSNGAFVIAFAIAARMRWISSRDLAYVAPIIPIVSGISIGNFYWHIPGANHGTHGIVEMLSLAGPFTLAIGFAMYAIWRRTKRDELEALTNPQPKAKPTQHKKAPAGPPVSASELRKRKKKR